MNKDFVYRKPQASRRRSHLLHSTAETLSVPVTKLAERGVFTYFEHMSTKMKARLTPAAIGDITALNNLSIASKMQWNYPEEWMEKWKDGLALTQKHFSEQRIFKLTEDPASIIGFCAIKKHEHEYEIMHLWIMPAYIGKGYGKYLLNESIQRVVVKEKPIIVEADPNAEQFYSQQGFITFSKGLSYPNERFLPLMRRTGLSK